MRGVQWVSFFFPKIVIFLSSSYFPWPNVQGLASEHRHFRTQCRSKFPGMSRYSPMHFLSGTSMWRPQSRYTVSRVECRTKFPQNRRCRAKIALHPPQIKVSHLSPDPPVALSSHSQQTGGAAGWWRVSRHFPKGPFRTKNSTESEFSTCSKFSTCTESVQTKTVQICTVFTIFSVLFFGLILCHFSHHCHIYLYFGLFFSTVSSLILCHFSHHCLISSTHIPLKLICSQGCKQPLLCQWHAAPWPTA